MSEPRRSVYVGFLLIDHNRQPTGQPTKVRLYPDTDPDFKDFIIQVKRIKPKELKGCAYDDINLWKPSNPIPAKEVLNNTFFTKYRFLGDENPGDEVNTDALFVRRVMLRERVASEGAVFHDGLVHFLVQILGRHTTEPNVARDKEDLRTNGYEVIPAAVEVPEAAKMPPNILTVRRSSDPKTELIAKKIRNGSRELAILKFLHNTPSKSENIIPMLNSFRVQFRLWIIFPKLDSLGDYIKKSPKDFSKEVVKLCLGLIKGVAYLHAHLITHRDIKPDNLLLDKNFCLKIIDFDISLQLKDEHETVGGLRGTEGWYPPEVENWKEPSKYSPIKADRWACGRVLLYLLNRAKSEEEPLRIFAKELRTEDPDLRPSLLEWRSRLPQLASGETDLKGDNREDLRSQDKLVVDEKVEIDRILSQH